MATPTRTVAIFTGNRSEYGLLVPVIRAISKHSKLEYRLLASGAHLDPNWGRTRDEITADGFVVHHELALPQSRGARSDTAEAVGHGVLNIARVLSEIHPDWVLVYGDRFEAFAATIAATQMVLPTAHIEGGDVTQGGALDDSVRHAMSKLAHVHFATNADSARRLLALGEEPWRVHEVGLPALDAIAHGDFSPPLEVAAEYALDPARPIVLFTQHSVATQAEAAGAQIAPSLAALRRLADDGVQIVVTYPNNDAGGREMICAIEEWKQKDSRNVQVYKSLGRRNYHGMLALCGRIARGACIGNSSSGVKESTAFGCPTIDIGTRQAGRLRGENVLSVSYDAEAIYQTAKRAIFDDGFRQLCETCPNPYGTGDSGARIAELLATIPIDGRLINKQMTV